MVFLTLWEALKQSSKKSQHHNLSSDIESSFNFLNKFSSKYLSNECWKLLESFKKYWPLITFSRIKHSSCTPLSIPGLFNQVHTGQPFKGFLKPENDTVLYCQAFTLHCPAFAFPNWFAGWQSCAKKSSTISMLRNCVVFTMKIIIIIIIIIMMTPWHWNTGLASGVG